MKHTKANVIKLLKKRQVSASKILIECDRDGDKRNYDVYLGKLYVYEEVIKLLTDEDYFNYVNNIFKE